MPADKIYLKPDSLGDGVFAGCRIRRESGLVGQRFDESRRLDPFHLAHRRASFVQRSAHVMGQCLGSAIDGTADSEPLFEAMSERVVELFPELLELWPLQNGRPANHSPSRIQIERAEPPREPRLVDL